MSVRQAELTADAGGSYVIALDVDEDVIRRVAALGMVAIPGTMTSTEIMAAQGAGAGFVKLFPAANLGVDYVKAVRVPQSHVKLLAVGGISEKNLAQFLEAGMIGAGVGGNLANKAWIEKITETVKQLMKIAEAA